MITNFKYRIFTLTTLLEFNSIESIYVLSLTSTGFMLIVLWYVLLYSFTISSNLLIYTFFYIEVTYFQILVFKVLINFSATTDFPSLCIKYISISLSLFFHRTIVKFASFVNPYFVWFTSFGLALLLNRFF